MLKKWLTSKRKFHLQIRNMKKNSLPFYDSLILFLLWQVFFFSKKSNICKWDIVYSLWSKNHTFSLILFWIAYLLKNMQFIVSSLDGFFSVGIVSGIFFKFLIVPPWKNFCFKIFKTSFVKFDVKCALFWRPWWLASATYDF